MNYYSILTDFYQKLFSDGLDVDDYYLLKDYEKSLCQENSLGIISDDDVCQLLPYFRELFNSICLLPYSEEYKDGRIHEYHIDYLKKNCSLVPLFLANNNVSKFRILGGGNVYFLCQFHNEETPSMCVTLTNNLYFYFGCGITGNSFDYLMKYENISFRDSVDLLARIYNISLPENEIAEDDILVKKYKESLFSEQYSEILNILLDKSDKYTYNLKKGAVVRNTILHQKQEIERIKNGESNDCLVIKKLKLEFPKF